ncbi:MAG: nucleotide sugar dehydrogenase [Alphaproteobacteria bacterium]|nr:MAG: nucleotide sugar dehydrogenase [Alphaproteobacteria bacterium]
MSNPVVQIAAATPSVDVAGLLEKFENGTAVIGVIGLGYVGLPLSCAACDADFQTIGFDVDSSKIEKLEKGKSYIGNIHNDRVSGFVKKQQFRPTSDLATLMQADAVIICVPTPLTRYREPDLSYIISTTEQIATHLRPGQLVVLESTTYPGTTQDVMRPILEEKSGLKSGEDFFLAYSPEREDPGNLEFTTSSIPKVVGGDGEHALALAQAFYNRVLGGKTVPVSSPATAEAVKLTENIFRAVNIALVNELKTIYDRLDIDIWEVIEAAKTKPFGYMPFYPGPGLGGHCIPIDPFYLSWKAREHGITTRFIELAGEINISMPAYVTHKLGEALNEKFAKPLNGAKILLIGVAYKKNVADVRESPAFAIMELLKAQQADISFHDPFVDEIPPLREHPEFVGMQSTALTAENLSMQDAVIIVTDHTDIDYDFVAAHSSLVIDTRNALKNADNASTEKIVKA